ADAIRAALPSGRIAANDEGDAALVAALTSSGLLDEPALMALLLRRADEERIATAARARSGRREARVLQGLESHDDERGIDALTAGLVHFLDEAGGLTDELILGAANEGEVAFVAEVLARR